MDLQIRPEPTPEEREAIERALGELVGEGEDPRGRWWQRGIRENLDEEEA